MSRIISFCKKHMIIILAVIAVALVILPLIVTKNSILTVAILILIYMIIASGLNLTNGYIGLFNTGVAGFMCIGAYVTALLSKELNANFFVCVICSAVITAIIGVIFALPTNKFQGFYFAITTLGFSEIIRLIAFNWMDLTNGPNGISGIKRPTIFGISFQSGPMFYYLTLTVLVVVLFCIIRILNSRVGRAWISIRENADAASSLGVNVALYKSINFFVMGFVVGIGGSLLSYYYGFIAPDLFMIDNSQEVLAMVMIGGAGSVAGPIVGAFLLTLGTQLFRSVSTYRMIAYSVMLLIMMYIRPQGLIGRGSKITIRKS